jgi:hypothetical protein
MRFPCFGVLKFRTFVTRRVSEGKTGSASSLAYASGFYFRWKTDNAQLQNVCVKLTTLLAALCLENHAAVSGEWAIHNQVFSQGKVISASHTIIKHEAIYDFLQETNAQITRVSVYFPRRGTFRILDPDRSIQTEISEDELARLVAGLAVRAQESDPIYRFAANPRFQVSLAEQGTRLRLQSKLWNYDVETMPADSSEMADEYKRFADAFARLNVLWAPTPPHARLVLNRELHRRSLLPKRVHLTLNDDLSFSTHSYHRPIPADLQDRISQTSRQLGEFRIVSMNELRSSPEATQTR